MDKYTVDLDQVLNDFEYSELTDQQSKHASERPQSSVAFQPAPITKHSINNVFHSLNEYLNSEISSTIDKVQLGESVVYDQQILSEEDNNLIHDIKETFTKTNDDIKLGLDITSNQLQSFNNSLENSGQNERLLKLKNEPQNVDIVEKAEDNYEHVNDRDVFKKQQLEQLQEVTEDVNLLNEIVQSNILNLVEVTPDSTTSTSIGNVVQNELVENNASGKSNDVLHKTDIQNFSLLDTENVESELIPNINCTENIIKREVENVYNDKECDKNIDNKADNYENNEQTNFVKEESFFTLSECGTVESKVNIVDILKTNEDKEISIKKTEFHKEKASYDSNNLKNIEDFVIEPSKSPYALGKDDEQIKEYSNIENISEIQLVDQDVRAVENATKLESTEELPVEKDSDIQETTTSNIEQISQNLNIPNEILTVSNDIKIVEDKVLKNTITDVPEENSTSIIRDEPKVLNQKVIVGFSTDIDIDDNELNKMLEDLEQEEGSGLNDVIGEEDLNESENKESKVEEVNDSMVVETLVPEGIVSKNNDDVVQLDKEINDLQSVNSEEKTLSQIDPPLEKPNNNEIQKSKENNKNQLIECLEIEKPSKSKKSSSKIKEKLEDIKKDPTETLQDIPNELKDTNEAADNDLPQRVEQENLQDVNNEPSQSLPKQHSHDSVTRPQDLSLKSTDSREEPTTRKINLIGSPGSTPYNNVYINKSIEPKTTQDTDSDYTSSASPTFSDCSTESTASTASVEDLPKNSDGVTKSHGHKHKHSEKGGVKNKEAKRGGDTGVGQGESNVEENLVCDLEHAPDSEEALDTNNSSHIEENASDLSGPGTGDSQERSSQPTETFLDKSWLGKEAPLWIPDSDAATCLHCDMKFTVLKRRHHCRACGLVLCSKCCNLKFRLEYLDAEARVCTKCYTILNKDSTNLNPPESGHNTSDSGDSPAFRPNPNNPSEYCSTVSPLQQIGPGGAAPPSVMVPVGVLKRKGSSKKSNKSVMFCDGIAPGSDLTHLDQDFNYQETKTLKNPKSPQKVPEKVEEIEEPPPALPVMKTSRNQPKIDQDTGSFIPKSETSLPPTVCVNKTDILYSECSNSPSVVEMLKNEVLTFAITQNLFVQVKLINMSCCVNKQAWCFSTDGLINVGSDEIVYLIEYIDEESFVPKDVFFHINNVYIDAVKGTAVKELGLSLHNTSNFLDSKNHAGFVYIRSTFQCLENVLKPKEPYLFGILIHRWETPWAKLFPLRLVLRLGAEYRYYPSPLISTRHRDSVFVEIGHTIINLLADFRNFTYTLPQIRGLIIHMEDKKTTISIPRNRYDQVMKSINNSSEHILAFAGNFSSEADSHLVCIQDTQGHENCYTTHAINIHNKPRKITGASFIVFNGSLKSTSGLTAKSNIVEDGLMIQIPSEHMDKIRDNLRNMKNHTIACGCINATSDETVNIIWGENDVDFNTGAQSPVDLSPMKGVPSIRVHNGKDFFCNNGARLIRWTEVFILQNGEENPKNQDPVDISKVSESIAKACCTALVKYLDLLVSNSCQKIGIRATLHVENVSYSAGSNGLKLPPIYMRSLDNELIPILHKITSNNLGDNAIELELIFRILNA